MTLSANKTSLGKMSSTFSKLDAYDLYLKLANQGSEPSLQIVSCKNLIIQNPLMKNDFLV